MSNPVIIIRPFLVAVALGVMAQPASAVVDLVFDPGLLHTTDALDANLVATGTSMVGVTVTVTYDDATSDSAIWQALPPNPPDAAFPGGAFGSNNDWSLISNQNTYPVAPGTDASAWVFENVSGKEVRSILIEGDTGDHVFDTRGANGQFTLNPPVFGTTGSGDGWNFDIDTNSDLGLVQFVEILPGLIIPVALDLDVTATYRDAVALSGEAPVGDLFRALEITFSNPNSGLASGIPTNGVMTFFADTDKLEFPLVPIPAPGAAVLAGFGLVAVYRRRRRGASV